MYKNIPISEASAHGPQRPLLLASRAGKTFPNWPEATKKERDGAPAASFPRGKGWANPRVRHSAASERWWYILQQVLKAIIHWNSFTIGFLFSDFLNVEDKINAEVAPGAVPDGVSGERSTLLAPQRGAGPIPINRISRALKIYRKNSLWDST